MGDMIRSMAFAIADAQRDVDAASIRTAGAMSGAGPGASTVKFGKGDYSLMELGFTPTFYQFVDTVIEVKIDIHMTTHREVKGDVAPTPVARVSTVTAHYSGSYNYSVEGSSLLRTKLVPVPPPAILEERIREELGE
jgi:hypothetical protein